MEWQATPYTLPLLIGAGISIISAFFTWKYVRVPGAKWASFLLLLCSEWMATYALELASAGFSSKIFWNKLQYVGIAAVPTAFLLFAIRYTDRRKWLRRRVLLLLAIEPLATLSLVFTNEYHRLIWTSNLLDNSGPFAALVNTYGLAFWANAAYSYTLLALVTVLLAQLLLRSGHIYKWQARSLLLAMLVPWTANALFITHLNPFPLLDLTSLAFTASSMAIAWAISGLRLRDIAAASRRAVIESMGDGVMMLDIANCIVDVNPAARRLIGNPDENVIGLPVEQMLPEWSDLQKPTGDGVVDLSGEVVVQRGGTDSTYDLRISPVTDWRGHMVGRVFVIRDITERKRLENELSKRYEDAKYLADRDSLTGLLNHRAIHERLEQELRRARRSGHRLSIIMMDVDGFKLFNDTYGHPIGDQVLREVAGILCRATRSHDIFGRFGGDEFLAILPETDTDAAIIVAERLRSELAKHPYFASGGSQVPIRLSFGMATFPSHGRQVHDLMGYADANLYQSKQQGGDKITVGGDEDRPAKVGTFEVLDGLVTAVDHKDHYTRQHSEDVTAYAMEIARATGLSEESQRTLRIAGLLHDIGKIGVPDRLLRKPGRLEEQEYEIMRQHVVLSELIIKEVPNQSDVVAAVGAHHERMDGSGYPRGLKGNEIPLLGRILAVADAYSAMTTDRAYRKAMSQVEARAELQKVAGTQLDPEIVAVFSKLLEEKEVAHGMAIPPLAALPRRASNTSRRLTSNLVAAAG